VLAATHQEGPYPTQYSNIYDLKNRRVYLFHYHNFEELLVIDLPEEMKKGVQSYEISSIFSRITLLGPGNGEIIDGQNPTISWTGLPDCTYRIIHSKDPGLSDPVSVDIPVESLYRSNSASNAILFPLALLVLFLSSKRKHAGILLLAITLLATGIQCEKDEEPEVQSVVEHSATLQNLEPNTSYYWKMEAVNSKTGSFSTETVVHTFKTGNQQI
jgi:hypothetical protein